MGEGAGVLVLEELESAQARGATIYAEVLGYGASNDAYHLAQPDPESVGVVEMMRAALERAGVEPERVGYINAHGTSTPLGDLAETKAIKEVFGDHAYELAVSSTKSVTGHCFGAAGAIEAMMCVLAIHEGVIPPTINYETPDPECDLDYVPNEARARRSTSRSRTRWASAATTAASSSARLLTAGLSSRRQLVERAEDDVRVRERLVARRVRGVRDRDHAHPGGLRRADAGVRSPRSPPPRVGSAPSRRHASR